MSVDVRRCAASRSQAQTRCLGGQGTARPRPHPKTAALPSAGCTVRDECIQTQPSALTLFTHPVGLRKGHLGSIPMTSACALNTRAENPWKFEIVTQSRRSVYGKYMRSRSRTLSRARFVNVATSTRRGRTTTRRAISPATRSARASVFPQPAGATTRRAKLGWSRIFPCAAVGATIYRTVISFSRPLMLPIVPAVATVRTRATIIAARTLYLLLMWQNAATSSEVGDPPGPEVAQVARSFGVKRGDATIAAHTTSTPTALMNSASKSGSEIHTECWLRAASLSRA